MFQYLRNSRALSVMIYLCLLMEIMIPHAHYIGIPVAAPPHSETSPHVEAPQPKPIIHILSQIYRDIASFDYIPTTTNNISFDCFTEYVPLFGESTCPIYLSTHFFGRLLRAPPVG